MPEAYLAATHEVGNADRGGGIELAQAMVAEDAVLPEDGHAVLGDTQHEEL